MRVKISKTEMDKLLRETAAKVERQANRQKRHEPPAAGTDAPTEE